MSQRDDEIARVRKYIKNLSTLAKKITEDTNLLMDNIACIECTGNTYISVLKTGDASATTNASLKYYEARRTNALSKYDEAIKSLLDLIESRL